MIIIFESIVSPITSGHDLLGITISKKEARKVKKIIERKLKNKKEDSCIKVFEERKFTRITYGNREKEYKIIKNQSADFKRRRRKIRWKK